MKRKNEMTPAELGQELAKAILAGAAMQQLAECKRRRQAREHFERCADLKRTEK